MNIEGAFAELIEKKLLPVDSVPVALQNELLELGLEPKAAYYDIRELELLSASRIKSSLNERATGWLCSLEVAPVIGSTNSELVSRGQRQDVDGCVLSTEVQLAGRGRRGRAWVSPFAQNVTVSIGLNIDTPPTQIGAVSLVVGVAVARAIEALGDCNVQLKWPNDVILNGEKVAGILIELIEASRPARLVIGIGVNVQSAPGEEITGDYRATCLCDHLKYSSRNDVIARLIDQVVQLTGKFELNGLRPFFDEWTHRDFLRDQNVTLSGGSEDIVGVAKGIDTEGAYLIQTKDGVHRAIGGDLSLRARQT